MQSQLITPDRYFDRLINKFLEDTNPWWLQGNDSPSRTVAMDLKNAFEGLSSLTELNEKLFWKQINDIRKQYGHDQQKRIRGLRALVYFYNFIITENPDSRIFEDARTLYPSLLENRAFVTEWLEDNCAFLTFTSGLEYDGHEQYIFIIRGANIFSSKLKEVDYKKIDLSSIHSHYYRKYLFEYACSNINRLILYNPSHYNFSLNLLSEIKGKEGYINKDENSISTSEISSLIEGLFKKAKGQERQVNTYKSSISAFLKWCVDNNHINVDKNVFDGLKVFTNKQYIPKTSRPEASHIDALLEASREKVEKDESAVVFDTLLRLLLTTKLRISELCGLQRDSIIPQLKPGTYRIKYVSKTSHGDVNEHTSITPRDKALLDKVMAYNEPLISHAHSEYKNYIFIYMPNRKQYVRVVDAFSFRDYLKQLCKDNGIPVITATRLRKEYQSQAERFVQKEKLNKTEFKSLSGHMHVDTTNKHYTKTRLEEYFEEFYMIQLHERELHIEQRIIEQRIREKPIPKELERVGDTTHKCGACNASVCLAQNALPCFLCKDFITSAEFLPVFKRMVEEIDDNIIKTPNLHDKEDLSAVKEVLVKYIVELTQVS